MIIQKLLAPKKETCADVGMYFRYVDANGMDTVTYPYEDRSTLFQKTMQEPENADVESFPLVISDGKTLSFETYFNAFSIGKWRKYTTLSHLMLTFVTNESAVVRAYHALGSVDLDRMPDEMCQRDENVYPLLYVDRREISCEKKEEVSGDGKIKTTISFPNLPEEGIIYITIAPEDGTSELLFYGGAYETNACEERLQTVELALGICTFQREEFLQRNVAIVKEHIMDNPDSPLANHVEIYISDNGQSVNPETFSDARIHLFPNKNLGGAGGFTRTMIEALFRREHSPFTHMILMDDDIVLSPEVLERTYAFLRMMKAEYHDCMIGGEMFMLSLRYKQYEAGARWRGTIVNFYNRMWDLRRQDCVACNEVENPINYSGWWYSVIPTSIITKDNLPLPFFIHYDDMEYGVRNEKNGTILLNGICVWHPQGINKAAARMTYYDFRNMRIGMAGTAGCATAAQDVRQLTNRVVGELNRYRYEEAEICFAALEDFYRGPEPFLALDPIEKHAQLASYNYTYEPLEAYGLTEDMVEKNGFNSHFIAWNLWGIIRWLLPATRDMKVAGIEDSGIGFGARHVFHYDAEKKMGFLTTKSYRRGWADFVRYYKIVWMIRKNHNRVMEEWAKAKEEMKTLEFWERYLGIEEA